MNKVASKINKKTSAVKKNSKLKIKVKSKTVSKKQTHKVKAKVHKVSKKVQEKELIVIDESQGLIFDNDKTLFGYFSEQIKAMEDKYSQHYSSERDFSETEIEELENILESTLDDPDEIWIDNESFPDLPLYTLVKTVETHVEPFTYVAVVYLNTEEKYPSFVFIHFATKDPELVEIFRSKEIIYHRKLEAIQFAALDGDSLLEGDYLAIGLLESMMKIRSEKDIPASDFQKYGEFRDETINNPDEIWRKVDSEGNTMVTFIRDISEQTKADHYYVVVTEEDPNTEVHSLLFSFPTCDVSLVDRYRQGENLEAEEVSTENSH
ncbi:MAG: PBECR2 nuclease fold domain-containing protein [Pseudobdellovibrio sp.]